MKKRNYLSPHTWQQSNMSKNASAPLSFSSEFLADTHKKPLKIGRYLALLCLAIIILFLLFHHSSKNSNAKPSLAVAAPSPTIQTITLPTSQTA